ncbi:hypothetical protein J2847_001613 [Azospirillum agricola]|uniref:hypothetical protein n=1 Tax=Azospirillum agricola TaxID=1720247 RepID=UPI001AE5F0A0|nr:hypothetical protein [Azospirillum agricola]MBP2228331.1 hypothetical protein [Azospirillum agricola]
MFKSRRDVKLWLRDKPIDWSRALAFRIALRVLPLDGLVAGETAMGSKPPGWRERLILATIRANFLALPTQIFPGKYIIAASNAAASTAAHAAAAATAAAAAHTVADAADAAYAATDAAADATHARAYAAAADVWLSLSNDAYWLLEHQESSDTELGALLAKQPLWPEGAPKQIHNIWIRFAKSDFATAHGFHPWIRWYEALAGLKSGAPPRDFFGETLTLRIGSQENDWWRRPPKAVNADIVEWLKEKDDSDSIAPADVASPAALADALDKLPAQQPAPYLFDWRDGRLEILPPDALPEDGGIAQDYLDEARDKAQGLLDDLADRGHNLPPDIARKVGKLREVLSERTADLRPALVDSRTISLERLANALDNPQDKAELPSRILADLGDLADTARRLCHCLPTLWRRDVDRLANSLSADNAATLILQLDMLREGVKDAEVVGPDTRAAFATLSEDSAEPAADDLKRWRVAMYALSARNFLTALLRVTKGSAAVAKELFRFAQDVRKELRPELVKGTAKMIIGGSLTVVAAACLFVTLLEPASGIAKVFPEFERIIRLLETVKPGKSEPPSAPPSAPPPLSPRTPRPAAEKGPTRPA